MDGRWLHIKQLFLCFLMVFCKDVTHSELTESRKVNDLTDSRDRNILIECQYCCLPCNIFPFLCDIEGEKSYRCVFNDGK